MTIFAFTEHHNDYPAYVNVSEQPDGTIKLSVRTRGNGGRDYASIGLSKAQAEELAEAIFKNVYKDEQAAPTHPVADSLGEECEHCGRPESVIEQENTRLHNELGAAEGVIKTLTSNAAHPVAGAAVAEGWRLVPDEMTDEMYDAAAAARCNYRAEYRAAILAAPASPAVATEASVRDVLERAAVIAEGFCAVSDEGGADQESMDLILQQRGQRIRALKDQSVATNVCCGHDSDCAVHNAPALPVGPCDCSLSDAPSIPEAGVDELLGLNERELIDAAEAVVARWYSPKWKDEPHTAVFIDRLRAALKGGQSK